MLRKLIGQKTPQQPTLRWQTVATQQLDSSGTDAQVEAYYQARTSNAWLNADSVLNFHAGFCNFQKLTGVGKQFRANDYVVLHTAAHLCRSYEHIDGTVDTNTNAVLSEGTSGFGLGSTNNRDLYSRWSAGPDTSRFSGAHDGTEFSNWRFVSVGGAAYATITEDTTNDQTMINVLQSGFGGGKLILYANDTTELQGYTQGEYVRVTVFIKDYQGFSGSAKLYFGATLVDNVNFDSGLNTNIRQMCGIHRVDSTGKTPNIEVRVETGGGTAQCAIVGIKIDRDNGAYTNGNVLPGRYDATTSYGPQVNDFFLSVGNGTNSYPIILSSFYAWFNANRKSVTGGVTGDYKERRHSTTPTTPTGISNTIVWNGQDGRANLAAFRWQDLWDYFRDQHPTLPADWAGYDLYSNVRHDFDLVRTAVDTYLPDSLFKEPYRSKMLSQGGTAYDKRDVVLWDADYTEVVAISVLDFPFDGVFKESATFSQSSPLPMDPRKFDTVPGNGRFNDPDNNTAYISNSLTEGPDGFTVSGFGILASCTISYDPSITGDGSTSPSFRTVGSWRAVPTDAEDDTKQDLREGGFVDIDIVRGNSTDYAGHYNVMKVKIHMSLSLMTDLGDDVVYVYDDVDSNYLNRTSSALYLGA